MLNIEIKIKINVKIKCQINVTINSHIVKIKFGNKIKNNKI